MAEIRNYVRPHELFRYRSVRDLQRELETIRDAYLFCSSFERLNDPMEGLFSSTQRVRGAENYRIMRQAVTDNKAGIGICSFSEVPDHELMWAHYAHRFAGICVGYRFSKLLTYLPAEFSFVRIFYSETVPMIRRQSAQPDELAKMILSYKNHRWFYEREWRMLGQLGQVRYHHVDCVSGVYLGSRIAPEHREEVSRRLSDLDIPIHEMNIRKYSLSFERSSHGG